MKLKYILTFTAIIALTSFCSAQGTTTATNTSKATSSSSPTTNKGSTSGSASGSTTGSAKSSTTGSTTSPTVTGYTPVPTADANDIANLPKFTYNLISEDKTVRSNICLQNENYCLTSCGGSDKAPKNFCNETTMGWGCGCSLKKPDFNFYEWPVNVEDCRKRSLACTAACQNDTTPVDKKADCNTACNKVYAMQCGTANQVYYHYEVDNESDTPSYISNNDPSNPFSNTTTTSGGNPNNPNGGDEPSGASIQNPIIWAISALAIVAAGMMTL
ncbi:hypothetical protein Glove_186g51 [Diversispora epigaea]|uniref:DUF7707 domain-containing protein n=1 Tax=Diversispora epigaea TaxID=1348612 RepID=A0A397IM81_9GLOM|nr:hypothetical protein Glove_186g51 [Diversispora epigaea]